MVSKTLKHRMHIILGDWSNDGHGKTESFFVQSNYDAQEIETAYKAGIEKLGFDFGKEVACDFEDNEIEAKNLRKMIDAGLKLDVGKDEIHWADDWEDENQSSFLEALNDDANSFAIDVNLYLRMYMFVIQFGAPTFKYKIEVMDHLHIGGYGLFW